MNQKKKVLKDNASIYGFIFYFAALLLWAIYDFFVNDTIGLQLPILFIGFALFLWTKFFYQQKKAKESS
ncbi:hypothetical protein [Planococcus beigongshangi]|uniref:hypothetical protein n=1 Tax=Planococcus beigongshangi TaxID=2782536 RepID=UPI00193B8054|nr:hypothetical protein [Planococcus beigongshangi]